MKGQHVYLRPLQISPRSRLFHLEPIEVNTGLIESLTSYIARLAQEHSLTTHVLVKNEIAPVIGKYISTSRTGAFSFRNNLNGTGVTALNFVRALEKLTGHPNLHYMTMVAWANVLTNISLFRRQKAWCPICYEDFRRNEQAIYDPLLWALAVISVCPTHKQPLISNCYYCGKSLPIFAANSKPGHCNQCKRWLGNTSHRGISNTNKISKTEFRWQLWKSNSISEILAAAQVITPPTRNAIAKSLENCIHTIAWGQVSGFASQIGVSRTAVKNWLNGIQLPILDTVLRICFKYKISTIQFLCGDIDDKRALVKRSRKIDASRAKRILPRKPLLPNGVKLQLEAALDTYPPSQSLLTLQKNVKWSRKKLKNWFPELCAELIAHYGGFYRKPIDLKKARSVIQAALLEEPPPSLGQLTKRIGCKDAASLHQHFPTITPVLITRYKKYWHKQINWELIKGELLSALNESPPPSLASVVRKLGLNEAPYDKFPDLCKAIGRRYISYVQTEREEKRRLILEEVREAVINCFSEGLYPSRERVNVRLIHRLILGVDSNELAGAIRIAKNELGIHS